MYVSLGSGKSSLVRVIGGLWQPFAGKGINLVQFILFRVHLYIVSNFIYLFTESFHCIVGYSDLLVDVGDSGVMFVPQEPYLTSGSLAEQVNAIDSDCLNPKFYSDYPRGCNTLYSN